MNSIIKKTGANALFERLIKHNVKYVFGYPGGAILPVLNEFYNQNKIKYILSRTEAGGSFMAEGYAKATKSVGVVMVTSGPGAINTMTSIQNALSDGTPLLVLTGQVSTVVLGTDAFQEADVINISKPITKWNHMITDVKTINKTVDTAFIHMMDKRPGPVLIDLPKNVMSSSMFVITKEEDIIKKEDIIKNISEDGVITPHFVMNLLLHAKKPVILAGQGILQSDSSELLRNFANRYAIPVTTTLMGLGSFPEHNNLSLKMLGMHGSYYANHAVQNCDLLINFGSRFDDRIIGDPTKFAPHALIIHVDILKKNINKIIKKGYYINDNCRNVLEVMLGNNVLVPYAYKYDLWGEWQDQINEWKKIKFSYPDRSDSNLPLYGREVIAVLNTLMNKDMINCYTIIADVGAHQMWAAQFIDYDYPKIKFLTSGGLGSMGYALPASIGVKIGLPKDKVICICGDGGFTMSFVELLTAVENKVNIKVIVINNSYQLMVKMWQEKFYDNQIMGVKMNNPAFEDVCKSMGCHGIRINQRDKLEEQLKYVLNYEDGPIVANVITDENEAVLPMVSPGKALDDMIIDEKDTTKYSGDAPC